MLKWYVYLWRDPQDNIPRYVGKGQENRVWDHIQKSSATYYSRLLKKRYRDGYICLPQLIWVNTEKEAYELETLLIQTIGRKDRGEGPLLNNTDGGGSLNPSPETKLLIAERARISTKISWTIPVIREKRTASLRLAASDPEVQRKKGNSLKITLSTPEAKLKRSATIREMLSRPEVQTKRSASIKLAFSHEETKAKRSAYLTLPASCIVCRKTTSVAGVNAHFKCHPKS